MLIYQRNERKNDKRARNFHALFSQEKFPWKWQQIPI